MKGLLSASFGTSYEETRAKTIDVVDQMLREAFPEREFFSAWTSGKIIAKVRKERGEHHDTLDEALARLEEAGIDDLLVTTMCLMDGHEMAKITTAVKAWAEAKEGRTLHVAAPLLNGEEDRRIMAQVLSGAFADVPSEDAVLFMGHGSQDAPKHRDGEPYDANAVYGQIQDELHALGRTNFYLGTVEGTPTFEDAFEQISAQGASCVCLAPFMIVAGDHATNDLAGDDEDSWKSLLEAQGMQTKVVLRGLGEYEGVQRLVVDHARAALDERA